MKTDSTIFEEMKHIVSIEQRKEQLPAEPTIEEIQALLAEYFLKKTEDDEDYYDYDSANALFEKLNEKFIDDTDAKNTLDEYRSDLELVTLRSVRRAFHRGFSEGMKVMKVMFEMTRETSFAR